MSRINYIFIVFLSVCFFFSGNSARPAACEPQHFEQTRFFYPDSTTIKQRIAHLEACCDVLKGDVDLLESKIERCCSLLSTRTEQLETAVDYMLVAHESGGTSVIGIDERIQSAQDMCDFLHVNTESLHSCLDTSCSDFQTINESLESQLDHVHGLQIDPRLDPSLFSRVDILALCCEQLRTGTAEVQSQFDVYCTQLGTMIEDLQSQTDVLHTLTLIPIVSPLLRSLVDRLDDCLESVESSSDEIASDFDMCCESLKTSVRDLQWKAYLLEGLAFKRIMDQALVLRLDTIEACCNSLCMDSEELLIHIDQLCDELRTSTGFLQDQVDELATMSLTACLDPSLVSRFEDIEQSCQEIRVRASALQSQLDRCCSETACGVEVLRSQIDEVEADGPVLHPEQSSRLEQAQDCCNELNQGNEWLASQMQICCSNLATSTGVLQSSIDFLHTLTFIFELDREFVCRVSSIDCFDPLSTSTNELQSQIDECCSQLVTSTGQLQSQLDGFLSFTLVPVTQDLGNRLSHLDTCCENSNSTLDELTSKLEEACDALSSSTNEISSRIDECYTLLLNEIVGRLNFKLSQGCSSLKTSTGHLQSQIDGIRTDQTISISDAFILSQLEVLSGNCGNDRESAIDDLIGNIICDQPLLFDTCRVTFADDTGNQLLGKNYRGQILSVDWTSDGRYLALGLSKGVTTNNNKLLVYEVVDHVLVFRAEYDFDTVGDQVRGVRVLRWLSHRLNGRYRLAAGRNSETVQLGGEFSLFIFDYDPVLNNVTLVDKAKQVPNYDNAQVNVEALGWHPTGLPDCDTDILAIGSNTGQLNQVEIFKVFEDGFYNPGNLTDPPSFSQINAVGSIERGAMDWDATGSFLAIGVLRSLNDQTATNAQRTLQIFTFNPSDCSLTENVRTLVEAFGSSVMLDVEPFSIPLEPSQVALSPISLARVSVSDDNVIDDPILSSFLNSFASSLTDEALAQATGLLNESELMNENSVLATPIMQEETLAPVVLYPERKLRARRVGNSVEIDLLNPDSSVAIPNIGVSTGVLPGEIIIRIPNDPIDIPGTTVVIQPDPVHVVVPLQLPIPKGSVLHIPSICLVSNPSPPPPCLIDIFGLDVPTRDIIVHFHFTFKIEFDPITLEIPPLHNVAVPDVVFSMIASEKRPFPFEITVPGESFSPHFTVRGYPGDNFVTIQRDQILIDPQPIDFFVNSRTVNTVSWNPFFQNVLAVGIDLGVQIFEHDGQGKKLTFKTFRDDEGNVFHVDWHPNGRCLAVGGVLDPRDDIVGMRTYVFNRSDFDLILSEEFTDYRMVRSLRWSPVGNHIALGALVPETAQDKDDVGDTVGLLYRNNLLPLQEVASIIEDLGSRCDGLSMSIGGLESDLDAVVST